MPYGKYIVTLLGRPKTLAGIMLKDLASDLYNVKTQEDAKIWIQRLFN